MTCRAFPARGLRIAYVGLPLGALALADAGFSPVVIALGHLDAPGARRVRRQLGRHALVLAKPDLGAPAITAVLAHCQPDVMLSWFWPKRIPEPVLALPRLGAYGVHPSLLPRHRGPDPYFWALRCGDVQSGVTLHCLSAEYDTGPIAAQRTLDILPNENAFHLAHRLDRISLPLLVMAAQVLSEGKPLPTRPQSDADASSAPSPSPDVLSIDWRLDAASIVRLVRAAAPYPGAVAELGTEVVDVLEASVFPGTLPKVLLPAEAIWKNDSLIVQSGGGGVVVRKVRCADGSVLRDEALAGLFGPELSHI